MPLPSPFELYIVSKDGKRERLDPRMMKKLGKVYDM